MLKCSRERWVWAPQSLSAGTSTMPMLSVSFLVSVMASLLFGFRESLGFAPKSGNREVSSRSRIQRRPSRSLHLNELAGLRRRAGDDDQITALGPGVREHQLPYRADGIDNGRPCRIGREGRERLERAAAVGPAGERENVWLLRRQTGDRRLEHLGEPLLEQRDAGRGLSAGVAGAPEREMGGLSGDAQGLQVPGAGAVRH